MAAHDLLQRGGLAGAGAYMPSSYYTAAAAAAASDTRSLSSYYAAAAGRYIPLLHAIKQPLSACNQWSLADDRGPWGRRLW